MNKMKMIIYILFSNFNLSRKGEVKLEKKQD